MSNYNNYRLSCVISGVHAPFETSLAFSMQYLVIIMHSSLDSNSNHNPHNKHHGP